MPYKWCVRTRSRKNYTARCPLAGFELSERGTKAETTFSLKAARLVIIELPGPGALPDSTLCNRDEIKPISV
jgi:hypothetical protein